METTTYYLDPDTAAYWEAVSDYYEYGCPACGQPMDYCQGHGEIGDAAGHAILEAHDDGNHYGCHPDGCDGGH